MSEEVRDDPIITNATATLEIDTGLRQQKVSISGVFLTYMMRDDGEWLEASLPGSSHSGMGREPEGAILSLIASILNIDTDRIA